MCMRHVPSTIMVTAILSLFIFTQSSFAQASNPRCKIKGKILAINGEAIDGKGYKSHDLKEFKIVVLNVGQIILDESAPETICQDEYKIGKVYDVLINWADKDIFRRTATLKANDVINFNIEMTQDKDKAAKKYFGTYIDIVKKKK